MRQRVHAVMWQVSALTIVVVLGGQGQSATTTDLRRLPPRRTEMRVALSDAPAISDLTFDTFNAEKPAETTKESIRFMSLLGKGIKGLKTGSFALIRSMNGERYLGWLSPAAVIDALIAGPSVPLVMGRPELELVRYDNATVYRRRDDRLTAIRGTMTKKTQTLVMDGVSKDCTYYVFDGEKLGDSERRLLDFLGIGRAGANATVRLSCDDRTSSARLTSSGHLQSPKKGWEPILPR